MRLTDSDIRESESSVFAREMARDVSNKSTRTDVVNEHDFSEISIKADKANTGSRGFANERQRKQGVYELSQVTDEDATIFKSVKQLRENYLAMLEKTSKTLSFTEKKSPSAEKDKTELLLPPPSDYCSSSASGGSDDERDKSCEKTDNVAVKRSTSSDSAVHMSDDDALPFTISSNWGEKREDCSNNDGYTIRSPYSPRGSIDHSSVPSRTIIEAQYVSLPVDRKFSVDYVSDLYPEGQISDSRRQSCFSEKASLL
ncbi:hypothetical protein NQ317_011135 [Molorchus minor]|uniref:Uncharacterized protein n=1 Tax=Molorchus minor TaxID=1323400 RepID=A0ABQ9IYW0_9CUCU|nr:hypothetical protein NQ317_011135 [Molorchus minor]